MKILLAIVEPKNIRGVTHHNDMQFKDTSDIHFELHYDQLHEVMTLNVLLLFQMGENQSRYAEF